MKIDRLLERRDLLCLSLAATAGVVVVLSLALVFCALRPRPVVVVPGARAPSTIEPEHVSDGAAVAFSLVHVYEFDSYTPGTVEAATKALKTRIADRAWAQASEGLDRRARVIQEGRISSHVVVNPEGAVVRTPEKTLIVTLRGNRRVFIADKLSRSGEVRYRLELECCAPTAGNPNGLAVVSQQVEEEVDAVRR